MGIDLFFSNQLEHLAEKMAHNIDADHHLSIDPFRPLQIIVPNTNLAKWLTLFLARRDTIVMNTDFQFLEIGLWQMIGALDPQSSTAIWRDHLKTRLLVLHELMRIDLTDPNLTPLSGYLYTTDGQPKPDYSVRIWQLAEKLATLYQEYEYHRSDMIRRWRNGMVEKETLARCEQKIYTNMVASRENLTRRSNQTVLSLTEYADQVLSTDGLSELPKGNSSLIHLFGLSQVSAFHLSLIERLGPHYEMFIYALNPSREFWEDIRTPAENRWIKHKNKSLILQEEEQAAGELEDDEDHPLLAAWGKPGRESVRLLCQLTDYTFHAGFAQPERMDPEKIDSVLACLQNDILTLGKERGKQRLCQDRSLQIYGCPGIQREVETVYHSILFNLSQEKDLQQTDIAVLVPNMTAYKPVFDQVFNRIPRRLTYSLVDSRADIESIYAQAILGLLELVTGIFSRRTVFDLILNPCFRHRWQVERDEVHIWAQWAEALNIFHTFENNNSADSNAPPSGLYTFKQGLQRLRMARIFSKDGNEVAEPLHYSNLVPFADTYTGDTDLLEKFCLVIKALDHAAAALQLGRVSASQWKQVLLTVTNDLLSIPPEYRGESAIRQGMFQNLEALSFFDDLSEDDAEPKIDATLIGEYLRSGLGAISGRSGDYLTEGVTISELTPMRPIPFKVIYVLGMEEGGFPGREDRSSLDLRLKKRRIGDISLPERNRYLFLETLLAARERLYISYISRDLQKDRVLSPGHVVFQLVDFLEKKILTAGHQFQMTTIPLKSSSIAYLSPQAVTTWSDICVNDQLVDRVVALRHNGLWPDIQERLSSHDQKRVSRLDPDLSVETSKKAEVSDAKNRMTEPDDLPHHLPDIPPDIQLDRLVRFLQNPLGEYARFHLGLFEDEPVLDRWIENEDEPFFSQFPMNWRLIMQPLYQWLDLMFEGSASINDRSVIGHLFDRFYVTLTRQSATPQGYYAERERGLFRKTLTTATGTLTPLVKKALDADTKLTGAVIGQPIDSAGPPSGARSLYLEATTLGYPGHSTDLSAPARFVSLHGYVRWLWHEKKTGWHILIPVNNKKLSKKPSKHLLKPALFYLMCRANNDSRANHSRVENGNEKRNENRIGSNNNPVTLHLANAEETRSFSFYVDPEEAANYFLYLVSAIQNHLNDLWLPFEVVTGNITARLDVDTNTISKDLRRHFKEEIENAFNKNANELERLINPPFPDDLFDQALDRFSIYSKLRPLA